MNDEYINGFLVGYETSSEFEWTFERVKFGNKSIEVYAKKIITYSNEMIYEEKVFVFSKKMFY